MTEPSESTSLAPTPSAATAWLVALVVPATLLAAFSGVPRYEISQLAIGAIAGGAAALALVMRGVVVQMPSMRSAAGAAILGAALLATVAVLGGLAHGMPATAGDEITRYALLLLGVVLTAAGVGGDRGRAVLGGAVALTAVACGVVSLLQLADVDVLPPIPFSTIPDRAPRSFFDDPAVAAAVLGPLAVTAALLASRAVGAVRVALLVGASLAALAAGLTGDVVLAVCAAIGLGAIAAAADGPARIGAGVAAVLAVAALALAPPADEDPLANPVEPSAPAGLLDYGRGFPWAASDAADWARDAGPRVVAEALPFGAGPDAFAAQVGAVDDNDSAWITAQSGAVPSVHAGPSALLDLLAAWGLPGGLAWLLLVGAAVVAAARAHSPVVALGVAVPLLAAWVLGLGAWGAPLALVTGLLLGAAVFDDDVAPSTAGLWRFALASLLVGSAGVGFMTLQWGLDAGAGHVFAGHGYVADAIEKYDDAADRQVRYESEAALALLLTLPLDDASLEERAPAMRRAVDHFDNARSVRPTDARVRYQLANHYARSLSVLAESEADAAERRSAVVSVLRRAVELDPNHIDAVVLLAQSYMMDGQLQNAAELLDTTTTRPVAPYDLLRVHSELGRLYADRLQDPDRALAAYERALAVAANAGEERRLQREVDFMRIWSETGIRPILDPREHGADIHDHGLGHDHNHGDHGDHDGHDHGGDAHDGHDHEGSGDGHEGHDHGDHDGHDHDDHEGHSHGDPAGDETSP